MEDIPAEKPDNGNGSGSEASTEFEVVEEFEQQRTRPSEEPVAVVDSTNCCECCFKKCLESIRNNKKLMNLLYWREPVKTGLIFAVGLIALCGLQCPCVSFISFFAYSGLLVMVVSAALKACDRFGVCKCDALKACLERPCTLKREDVNACVQRCVPHLNALTAAIRQTLRFDDSLLVAKVTISLLLLAWVGSCFNLLTLVTLGFVLAFVLPPIYERHSEQIDALFGQACGFVKSKLQSTKEAASSKLSKKQA